MTAAEHSASEKVGGVGELLARTYYGGSTVTNCMTHYGLSILDRPDDCRRCLADVKNTLSKAIGMNEWLNAWKNDATTLLIEDAS